MSKGRVEAASRAVELAVGANLTGVPAFPEKYYGGAAERVLSAADASDKADGIYRVSLDAAIEAAAKAECAKAWVTKGWDACEVKDDHRNSVRDIVTAAVMGGAQ